MAKQSYYSKIRNSSRIIRFRLNRRWRKALRKKKKENNKEYIVRRYTKMLGRVPDLENPKALSEKIQWLKLYYNNPLCGKYADKYAVRECIKEKGFGHILNGLIGVYESADEIPFEQLPNRFVIKANHGCHWNLVCKDKQRLAKSWKSWKKTLDAWLSHDYSIYYRELHYSYIPPRLICEEYLEQEDGGDIDDYRVFCFNGEPRFIQIDVEPELGYRRNYYDCDWNLMDLRVTNYGPTSKPVAKPLMLREMLDISRSLAEELPLVRIDFYVIAEKLYFGEITLTPASGFLLYRPVEMDYTLGDMLTLPDKNSPYVMLP